LAITCKCCDVACLIGKNTFLHRKGDRRVSLGAIYIMFHEKWSVGINATEIDATVLNAQFLIMVRIGVRKNKCSCGCDKI